MDMESIKELSDKDLISLAKKYIERMIIYPTYENERVYNLILKEVKERNIMEEEVKKNGK